jgi:hypothetical protein
VVLILIGADYSIWNGISVLPSISWNTSLPKWAMNLLHVLFFSYPQHCLSLPSFYMLKNFETLSHCPIILASDTEDMCQQSYCSWTQTVLNLM